MQVTRDSGTRGSAFILALVASVIIFAIVMSITALSTEESSAVLDVRTQEGARLIAEGGLNLIAVSYQQDGSGPAVSWGNAAQPLGGGTYQQLSNQLLEGPELRRLVTVEGVMDDETYRVEAVIGPVQKPLYDRALQANSDISMTNNANIDSYDSRVGPYNALSPGQGGNVAGNGNITLTNGASIQGDAGATGTISIAAPSSPRQTWLE